MTSWSDTEVERLEELFYSSTKDELESEFERSYDSIRRKAYRLDLERHDNIQRITSVKEVEQINLAEIEDSFANFICGFVAGEGTFTHSYRPNGTTRYRFGVQLADDDIKVLEDMQRVFDCGSLNTYPPRKETHKGSADYQINGFGEIVNRVIPFFDEYGLQSSRKQKQYDVWRANVLDEIPTERFI